MLLLLLGGRGLGMGIRGAVYRAAYLYILWANPRKEVVYASNAGKEEERDSIESSPTG